MWRALTIAFLVGCAAEARDPAGASGRGDDLAHLGALPAPAATCGDGTCDGGETSLGCPADCGPCGTVGYAGVVIDDGDACFEPGGPAASMRHVRDAGLDGDLVWTHTTEDAAEANYGQWHLHFEHAGRYRIEVYTDTAYAQSRRADYVVQHGAASDDVILDQTAVDGWQVLGDFDFEAGGEQWLHLADNTGEPLADDVQLVFDAVRLTRVETDLGSGSGADDDDAPSDGGGCAVGGHLGVALIVLVGGLRRRFRALGRAA